ncbi:hypothetical protein D3C72_2486340 [compost metagenome]
MGPDEAGQHHAQPGEQGCLALPQHDGHHHATEPHAKHAQRVHAPGHLLFVGGHGEKGAQAKGQRGGRSELTFTRR